MATTTLPGRTASPTDPSPHATTPAGPGRFRRLLRGRTSDPAWVRPALLGLLVATALLYLVDLSSSGYANSFYSAAVQAGTKSWKAFFFGSSDAANFITVDKPPASLWMMEIPARIFGVNAWTLLAPQALEGVAAVGLLYLTMRRAFSAGVGILAGAVLALTPVATLMFRFNNPDALLVLVLVAAAYATVRAVEHGRTRWLVAAGALVGFGFITKELQALVVVPPLALVYLVAGPPRLRRRILQLLAAGAALVVSAGWWVAAVQLTPAADRPYIGGSQNNSLLNVIFGYNGFGRLTGAESGSVGGAGRGGPGAGGSMWGPTGLLRMFNSEFGTQIAWLLPAALAAIVVGLWITRRTRRTNPVRAAFLLWGTWLLVTGLVFSLGQGIIHPYYSVALAPAVAALVAGGAGLLWARRDHWVARVILDVAVAGTVIWADVLLRRAPTWNAWLQVTVLVAGLVAAVGLALGPILGRVSIAGRGVGQVVGRRTGMAVGALALVACLAGPGAYSVATAATAYSSAIPTAGPSSGGGFGGGPRFGGAFRAARGAGGGLPRGGFGGGNGGVFGGGAGLAPPGAGGGLAGGGAGLAGGGAGLAGGGAGGATPPFAGRFGRFGGAGGPAAGGFGGGGPGGLLSGSVPDKALTAALNANASKYTWVAAAIGSESASGYQLATGKPVMAIGGFNGTDPYPALAAFQKDVAQGKIHYFIAGGRGGGGRAGPGGGGSSDSSAISTWVEAHFASKTVGGVTLYDLTAPLGT